MVTALCVAAQHPVGLDLQLRNLRWAIDAPKKIVVFTFKGLFQTDLYPDVEFVEVDSDPKQYYRFHNFSVGQWLYKHADEIVVMSELDTFFIRKIDSNIETVRQTGEIHVGQMRYWYELTQHGKVIMPRIWEGGLIMKSKQLLMAHDMGIIQGYPMTDRNLINKMTDHGLGFLIGEQSYRLGEEYEKNQHVIGDNYCSMNVIAYLMDYKVKSFPYISHVKGPETVHRANSYWYNNIDEHYEKVTRLYQERGPGTVFHLFLHGKASLQTLIKNRSLIKQHYWYDVYSLLIRGREWIPEEMYYRAKLAARIISES